MGNTPNSGRLKTFVLGAGSWSAYKARTQAEDQQFKDLQKQSRLKNQELIQGKFTDSVGGQAVLTVNTRLSDEGLEESFVKTKAGIEIAVTSTGNGFYAKSLSTEEARIFDKKNHGIVRSGFDTLGREKLIVVTDGDSGREIALQPDNGTWRDVWKDSDGQIYLGHQVDILTLPPKLRDKIFDDLKTIIAYAAPLTGPTVSRKVE